MRFLANLYCTPTTDSIEARVENLDTNYSHDDRIVLWYLNGDEKNWFAIQPHLPWVGHTFFGLNAGSSYNVKAAIYKNYELANEELLWSDTRLVMTDPEEPQRPSFFVWTNAKVKNQPFNLSALEWNSLTTNINAVRNYKNYSSYSFTTAYSGNDFTANMYNQARLAIQGISGYGGLIPTVSSGNEISAYMMNIIVSELNAIP